MHGYSHTPSSIIHNLIDRKDTSLKLHTLKLRAQVGPDCSILKVLSGRGAEGRDNDMLKCAHLQAELRGGLLAESADTVSDVLGTESRS